MYTMSGASLRACSIGLLAGGRFAHDDDDTLGQLEGGPQTLAGHGVVVDDECADRRHPISFGGQGSIVVVEA